MNPLIRHIPVVLLLSVFAVAPLRAQQPPEHVNAYVFGVRAEQAEADGKLDEALNLYAESLRLYRETAAAHPEWNPTVVQYRITTTANQLDRVQRAVAAEVEKQREAERAAVLAEQEKAVAEARAVWLEEKKGLDARIAELDAEQTRLLEAGRAVEAALRDARATVEELEKTVETREKRIKRLEETRDEQRDEAKAIATALAERDQQIAALTAQLADLPPPLITEEELVALRASVVQRDTELADVNARLAALQGEVESLSEATVAAEQRLADAQMAASAAMAERQGALDEARALLAASEEEMARLRVALAETPAPLITEEALRQLEADLSARTSEAESSAARISELEAALAGLQQTLQQQQEEHLDAMTKAAADAEKKVKRTEAKLKDAREEANTLRADKEALAAETAGHDAKRLALEDQLAALSAERASAVSDREALAQQVETLSVELAAAREAMASQPAPLITPDELDGLRAELTRQETALAEASTQLDARQAAEETLRATIAAMELELAKVRSELESARNDLQRFAECATMYARFEKAEVENIIYRDAIVALSNRIQSLTAQSSGANQDLSGERKAWETERRRMSDQIAALKETVDLNQVELDKVRDLRATVRALEKENRSLARRAKGADGESDAVRLLEQRIAELEAEVESLRSNQP
jgi:chromosome segregation ATPase